MGVYNKMLHAYLYAEACVTYIWAGSSLVDCKVLFLIIYIYMPNSVCI